MEDALTLCVTPTAVSDAKGYSTWVSAERLPGGVADIGTREEPDLDTLCAAKPPDLIVVEAFDADDETVKKLEKRNVPVMVTKGADPKDPIGNMRKVFRMIGEATGRTEADQVLKEFDKHLADVKRQVTDADLPTKEFLFFDC